MEFFCFAFLALIGGAARQNVTFSTELKMAAPRRRENKTQIKQTQNDKATLKQHVCRSSPLYLLLIPLLSFLLLQLRKLRRFVRASSLLYPRCRPREYDLNATRKFSLHIKAQVQRVYKADLDHITV